MLADLYLKNALKAIEAYKGEMPLSVFLKKYFKAHPQMGSRDRKVISELVYTYFRTGHALQGNPSAKVLCGLFLTGGKWSGLINDLKPEWASALAYSLPEKIIFLQKELPAFKLEGVFPYTAYLSEGVNIHPFLENFFVQPDLFIRIRKNKSVIINRLTQADISFKEINEDSLALPQQTKLQQLIPSESDYEVQDLSSQSCGKYFASLPGIDCWDACAGSGGKSILLHDQQPEVRLLVTDIRKSILHNLKARFKTAGIKNYECLQLDLTKSLSKLNKRKFDIIILDASCSGSGTWSRTPEQLYYFEEQRIAKFSNLQKQIADNAIPFLKEKGVFIYITCSVFEKENEEVVEHLLQQSYLRLESQQLIKGYEQKADSMFVARILRN